MAFQIENGVLEKYIKEPGVTEVVIPDDVTEIGNKAFSYCRSLTSVTIPTSVTMIGDEVFYYCTSLTSITLPESVTSIGNGSFYGCSSLTTVTIPDSVTEIGSSAFSNTRWLNNYPNDLVIVGKGVLYKYKGKDTNVVIPDNVMSIGEYAFSGCSSLTTVTIPDSVTSIGEWAFAWCSSLTTVTIPDSVMIIGNEVFHECSSLTTVTIGDSVMIIGNEVFHECSSLTTVTIGDSVTSIGNEAFYGCSSLTTVTIPDSVTSIGERAFSGCSSLTTVTIPDSVTSIGESAFQWCKSLTTVTIGDSVTSIGNGAFYGCSRLTTVTIPESVTKIGNQAFYNCTSLTSITLPKSVTEIGRSVFSGCASLKGITLPEGVTTIENTDYSGCSALERVVFPQSLEKIGDSWNDPFQDSFFGLVWFFVTHSKSEYKSKLYYNEYRSFANCLVQFLKDNGKHPLVKPNTFVKTAEYVLEHKDRFKLEDIQEIAEIAKERKAKKAVTLFDSFIKAQTASEEKQDERFAPLYKLFKSADLTTRFIKYENDIDIRKVKLKDSNEKAPEFVVKAALIEYLALFNNYKGGYGGAALSVHYCPNSDKAAEYLDADSLAKAVESAYRKRVNAEPSWIIPYCRYGTPAMIADIISDIPRWDKWATGGSQGRRRAKIAVPSVKLSKTKEAMMYYEKKKELDVYARFHNTTADILRDTVLADFGIDDEGKVTYDLGNKTITAALQDDLTFSLYDNYAQKIVKSIPKKGAVPELHAKASDGFKKLKADVKKVVKARNDLLFDYFLSGKTRPANEWLSVYPTNPVLRKVAELIVWNQGKDTFFLTKDGAVDCNGQPYTINENRSIGVAHPIEMDAETLSAWRDYFAEKKLKQPFEQIWEAAIDPSSIKEDRYKGCPLPFYYFRNRAKHGITIEDLDFHNEINIYFADCGAWADRLEWKRHQIDNEDLFEVKDFTFGTYTRQVNHIVYLLDKWTIRQRILKDDPTIGTLLDSFTLPQIMSFIDLATKNECVNATAVLLNYRNEHYPEYDGFAALDDLLLDDDF